MVLNARTAQATAAKGDPDRLHARERGYPCSLVHALDAKQRLAKEKQVMMKPI